MELRRLTTLAIDGFLEAPSGDFDEDICCVDSCRTRDSKLSYAAKKNLGNTLCKRKEILRKNVLKNRYYIPSCLFSCLLSFKAE